MNSNFSFLDKEFDWLLNTAQQAERHVHTDPMYCAILCRKSLEEFIKWLYDHDEDLEIPPDTTLNSLMHEQSFKNLVPPTLFRNINLVRKIGNNAIHTSQRTEKRDALASLKILHDFALWVVRLYSRAQTPVIAFDESLLPGGEPVERTRVQMQELSIQHKDVQQQLKRANEELQRNEQLAKQLQKKLETIHQVKQQNTSTAGNFSLDFMEEEIPMEEEACQFIHAMTWEKPNFASTGKHPSG